MATSTRFTDNIGVFDAGVDNTDSVKNNQALSPAYASTLAIIPYCATTTVQVAALTGAMSVTIGVGSATTAPYVNDRVILFLVSDGTTRTVTFSTGTSPVSTTFAVTTAKYGRIAFVFNGTTWIEEGRSISA